MLTFSHLKILLKVRYVTFSDNILSFKILLKICTFFSSKSSIFENKLLHLMRMCTRNSNRAFLGVAKWYIELRSFVTTITCQAVYLIEIHGARQSMELGPGVNTITSQFVYQTGRVHGARPYVKLGPFNTTILHYAVNLIGKINGSRSVLGSTEIFGIDINRNRFLFFLL